MKNNVGAFLVPGVLLVGAANSPVAAAQDPGTGTPSSPTPVPTAPTDPVDPGSGPLRSAAVRCNDFTIRFIDSGISQPYPSYTVGGGPALDPRTGQPGREMTAQFVCHGDGGFSLPTITTMHLFEVSGGKMCMRERSCGNLRHVMGYFGISLGWSRLTALSDYVVSEDFVRQSTHYNGLSLSLQASVSFEKFERSCSAPSAPVCIDVPR